MNSSSDLKKGLTDLFVSVKVLNVSSAVSLFHLQDKKSFFTNSNLMLSIRLLFILAISSELADEEINLSSA